MYFQAHLWYDLLFWGGDLQNKSILNCQRELHN